MTVLTWQDAITRGVVQEINRQVLHPAGYTMRLDFDPGRTVASICDVGPAHALVLDDVILPLRMDRAQAFASRCDEMREARVEALGYLRQPLSDVPEFVVAPGEVDRDAIGAVVSASVRASGLTDVAGDADLSEWACDTLAAAVLHALRGLAVVSPDGGATWRLCRAPRPALIDQALGEALTRGEHLCADIRRLQAESEAASKRRETDTGSAGTGAELLPSEWAEFEAAESVFMRCRDAAVAALAGGQYATVPDEMADALAELERLYGLAQPGMRVHRGDPTAFAIWDRDVRPALRDAARDAYRRMSEEDRLMARELWPWEDADWAALRDFVAGDMDAATQAVAECERSLREAMQRHAALVDAMKTVEQGLQRVWAEAAP